MTELPKAAPLPRPAAQQTEDLPFATEEYATRISRVRAVMQQRGLDLLYVTSPANLCYLTGYESGWFEQRSPTALVVPANGEIPVLIDTWFHQAEVPRHPFVEFLAINYVADDFYYPKGLGVTVDVLRGRGWLRGRIGVEQWSWTPGPPVLAQLTDLMSRDAEVVDASFLVDHVRLIKSPAEVQCMRQAVAIADRAMEAVRDNLAAGMTEWQVAGLVVKAMLDAGGEEPAIRMMVSSGAELRRLGQTSCTHRVIEPGDTVLVDTCGALHRYHGNVARTFSLGPNPFWEETLAKAEESIPLVVEAVRPGTPLVDMRNLMDAHIDRVGLRQHAWWINGYSLGLAFPPDWVGHVYLDPGVSFEVADFDPGFVVNYEHLFEDQTSGTAGGFIETLFMSDTGVEIASTYPRTLTVL